MTALQEIAAPAAAAQEEGFDVVVIGGGGSGLAAAIEARAAGARVLLLEKNDQLGGSTAWSVGSITTTGSPHQQRRGISDSPDDHFSDMPLFAPELASRDNDELRRILCDEIPDAFLWLQSLGVRFFGPMPEPPHRQPRMHNVLPNSRSFIYHLERRARRTMYPSRWGSFSSLRSTRPSIPYMICSVPSAAHSLQRPSIHFMKAAASSL